MPAERMSPLEVRAGVSLAGVYGLRMLGLFVILPVFVVHAAGLRGGDDLSLVGVALGAYGLAQGILQIPFGMASDRWGRKPALYVGLAVFAAGSFLGIAAHDIWTAIAARTLQGAGAISSVAMALAADLTREEHRTKIMAMIGSTIGLMFALSLVGAPVLYRWIGMEGLFALTGALSLVAMWVVRTQVPEPPARASAAPRAPGVAARLLEPDLLRLNAGIFILHILLYAMFVVVPTVLVQDGLALAQHWKLYLPVVLASFVAMVPAILYADRRNGAKPVLLASVGLLLAVEVALMSVQRSVTAIALLMFGFFVAFNVLEAMLPSLVSRVAPAQGRGAAIGVYNTTQTLGVFFGGVVGGWVAAHHGASGVFATCAVLAVVWLALAAGMRPVRREVNEVSSLTLSIASGVNPDGLREALASVRGVRQVEVLVHERIARIQVVPGQWDERSVRKLVTGEI
ncbi:MAG TPA: MFS transporter [Burkholderiales bacterium]|jgi:MFS family permease|nr:MFS transporter [Burkholderiales bacterium]